jgi:hypothetical protein
MKVFRTTFLVLCLVLFVGGYAGSQWATWAGRTESFYKAMLQPSIQTLSWVIVIASVVLFWMGGRDQGENEP